MVGIIHYGAGNIFSVLTTVERYGEKVTIISKAGLLKKVDRIILPGVGSFDPGMKFLIDTGLYEEIKDEIKKGKMFLGICLGMQMLFESSEEGKQKGLQCIEGKVQRFPNQHGLPVPHMGWNSVNITGNSEIFNNIPDGSFFYFAHSFYPVVKNKKMVIGQTEYGIKFASCVQKDNIIGVQFHPEKSGKYGLLFIQNYLKL